MKIVIIIITKITISFAFPIISTAQDEGRTVTTQAHDTLTTAPDNGWTVITLAEDTLHSCIIDTVAGNTVRMICDSHVVHIAVDSIKIFSRHHEAQFGNGVAFGALFGATFGTLHGIFNYKPEYGSGFLSARQSEYAVTTGILGALAGCVLGGILGAASEGDEIHELSEKSKTERIRILTKLCRKDR